MNIDTDAIRRLRDTLLLCEDLLEFNAEHEEVKPATLAPQDAMVRRIEPFAETMYLVMMADGEPASVERKALTGALHVLTDGKLDNSLLGAMMDRFEDNANRQGSEARLLQIGTRLGGDRDDRETAFTLAAVVALADNRVDIRENRILEWVKEYFGVSEHRSQQLLESID